MLRINLLAPKGSWFQCEKWRGVYTFFYRQPGQMFQTCVSLTLWGDSHFTKSFYSARKVKRVIFYQEN